MNEKFANWQQLFKIALTRDWKKAFIWWLGIGLFSSVFVPAFKEIAQGQGLLAMFETMRNPAMIAMVGPTPIEHGTDYTVGAMYAQEMLLFCGLFSLVVSLLHVVSHTRKEEELGLSELIRSFYVGRQANSLALMLEVVLINLILGAVITLVMVSFAVETVTVSGSVLFGLSIAGAGIFGGSLALVWAQIMPTAAGATGASLATMAVLYVLRAGTDLANQLYSLVNPIGAMYLTYPFTTNRWVPLLVLVVWSLILFILAIFLEEHRDIGTGYLVEREGRSSASKLLASVPGLLWHLNKGVIFSWLLAFVFLGVAYGSIFGDMQTFMNSNPLLQQMFTQAGHSVEASFAGTILSVLIGLVSLVPIVIINKLFAEETRGRLNQLSATSVSRSQLYWTTILLAVVASVVGIGLVTISLGGTAIMEMQQKNVLTLGDFVATGFNFLPVVLFYASLTGLLLGFAPKWGKVVYGYVAYSVFLNYFNGLLDLPKFLVKLSVASWLADLPIETFEFLPFIMICGLSVILMVVGAYGYQHRDLMENG